MLYMFRTQDHPWVQDVSVAVLSRVCSRVLLKGSECHIAVRCSSRIQDGCILEIFHKADAGRHQCILSVLMLHVTKRAGRIVNEKALRQRVFYSGVANEIRKEVWKFLLGLYPMSSTAAERADILKQKRLHYGRIKAQWTSICPEQAAK